MTRINTHYKADVVTDPAATGTSTTTDSTATTDASGTTDTPSTGEVDQLVSELDAAQAEIAQWIEDNAEFASEEMQNKAKAMAAFMGWEAQALKSGNYIGGPGAAGAGAASEDWWNPDKLEDGWNGIPPENIMDESDGQEIIDDDPAKYGDYNGSMYIPNSGDPSNPNQIAFQMTDDMQEVYLESHGRDIVVTVEYTDGHRESWVIKDGVVRPEPLLVSARGLTHNVKIDASRLIRMSDGSDPTYPYGTTQGIRIIGSDATTANPSDPTIKGDILIGSQGKDVIIGGAGDDFIDGMAGNDILYGDDYYAAASQGNPDIKGNDTIKGGAGKDQIYGGAGIDTSYKSDKGDPVSECETVEDDISGAMPASGDVFDSPNGDWVESAESTDDTLVIANANAVGKAGELNMYMPPGYSMAFAERDADNNLVITFVGDEGTFKVKILDFFSDEFGDGDNAATAIPRLTFHGSAENDIIDFSRIKVGSDGSNTAQVINIVDEDGGDDIILAPRNDMISNGVDPDDMLSSQRNSEGKLGQIVEEGIIAETQEDDDGPTKANGYEATANGDVIDITADQAVNEDERADKLSLVMPDGYTKAYMTTDAEGHVYVIFAKPNADGGKAQTIVVKIDKDLFQGPNALSYSDIFIVNRTTDEDGKDSYGITTTPILVSSDTQDYRVDGGDGADMIFTQKRSRIEDDPEDEIVEGEVLDDIEPMPEQTPEAATPPAEDPPPENN
jgi:hypothetical protein